ncbi:Transport system permease protein, partial [human gut metagenome]
IDDPMNGPEQTIIWLLRMPRLLMAAIIGAGLAVSGVIMQAIVKNPLADPYILGISSGASLGATVAILFGVGVMFGENFVGVMAFVGAMAISFGV